MDTDSPLSSSAAAVAASVAFALSTDIVASIGCVGGSGDFCITSPALRCALLPSAVSRRDVESCDAGKTGGVALFPLGEGMTECSAMIPDSLSCDLGSLEVSFIVLGCPVSVAFDVFAVPSELVACAWATPSPEVDCAVKAA